MTSGSIEKRLTAVFDKGDPHLMPILSYKGRDRLFNRVASAWTHGPFSHTELVLSCMPTRVGVGNKFLMASSSFSDGGVRLKSFTISDERWELTIVRSPKTLSEAFDWFTQHEDDTYSLLGLSGLAIGRPVEDRGSSFCNEAVGLAIGLKEAWRYDPNSFFQFIDLFSTGD